MRTVALAALLIAATFARADSLFADTDPLQLTLTGPLEKIVDDGDERVELPFVVTVGDTSVPVEIRTRGKSRLRVCRFPPLRLNFDAGTDIESVFRGYDKIKLVTHCSDKRRDESALYDEYFAYRLFSLLTDRSYRTRWARVRYVDSENPDEAALERPGFLIEPDDAFAERTGSEYQELPGVVYSKLDDTHATLVYVFQYLIGNTDWSLVVADGDDECCHNGDLFAADTGILLVPYDFDLAGIVNASYAKPDPSLRIRRVRSRIYRGYCTDIENVRSALDTVIARREDIMKLAETIPSASPKDREQRIEYLEDFFDEAEDPEDLLETFDSRCIG
jgi:hypothetical protein